jgi:glycine/D-amino acid oxidase-like deaminating enzyme
MTTSWKLEKSKKYPALSGHVSADIVVVGGGLAGIWCAYLLSKAGKKVVVLDKGRIGHGETLNTTAFITQAIDTPLSELIEMFDMPTARAVWSSGARAIDLIETVSVEERIECEFMRMPIHLYARVSEEYKELAVEHLLAERLGFNTSLKKTADLGFPHLGVLSIEHQAKYHPMKFLLGLAEAARRHGAEIYENTEVGEVVGNTPIRVVTTGGQMVSAESVVIATYNPLGNPKATRLKKGMYTSYCIELTIPKGEIPEGMYMDQHNPYHYVRVDAGPSSRDRMIVGGEDHRSELKIAPEKSFRALRAYVKRTFPGLKARQVRRWTGGIMESSDGLALIGETAPNRYVATAFSGNGMTYAAIAGRIISDLILKKDNPYQEIYDPKRKLEIKALLQKARDYTAELFGGAGRNMFR